MDGILELSPLDLRLLTELYSPRSPVIAAAINAGFPESKTKTIRIEAPSASSGAINRMLDYVYLHRYNDGDREEPISREPIREVSFDTRGSKLNAVFDTQVDKLSTFVTRRMINNIHLYALAGYYQINDLSEIAFSKIYTNLTSLAIANFPSIVFEVS